MIYSLRPIYNCDYVCQLTRSANRPTCQQCQGTNLLCQYNESNKRYVVLCSLIRLLSILISLRGIPTGYLGTLEQRLNETEAALYNALAELRNLKSGQTFIEHQQYLSPFIPPVLIPRESNPSKTSRMAEWKEHPLTDSDAIDRWRVFFSRHEKSSQSNQFQVLGVKM